VNPNDATETLMTDAELPARRARRRRPLRTRALAGLGGALVTLAALLVAPHASAETEPSPAPGAPSQRFTGQPVTWAACDDESELQCATIEAPVDYLRPDAGTLRITFSKLATSVPAKRRGVLFLNPGGPGAPGLDEPRWRGEGLPQEVRDQYDLIGFDPRGIGRSSALSCGLVGDEAVQSRPYRPQRFTRDVAAARAVAAKCAATPTAGQISTRNTARDMDLIRAVLGEPKISYYGLSYGTFLGAAYTQLFPGRTDRVVLDSNLDPARIWRGVYDAMADGATAYFDRFTRWTAERDATYHLGRTPRAVEKSFWDLAARVAQHPIQIDGQSYTAQEARSDMVYATITGPEDGVAYLRELRGALDGKPHDLSIPEDGGPDDAFTSPFWSVLCNDSSTWPQGEKATLDDIERSIRRYPLVGDFLVNANPCGFWSLPHTEPDLRIGNQVPVLLLQNEWDLQTPGPMGVGMHRALRGSRLVMVEKAKNHGVYDDGNPCAVEVANSYLATGVLPNRDVTCPAVPEQRRTTDARRPAVPELPFPGILARL
jgi:pimeloyl-ACP methyl ester carboxylesterase